MAESTRPSGATGAGGGGGSGRWPEPSPAGPSLPRPRQPRPAELIEAVLRDRGDDDLARGALRLRKELRTPLGLLLTCGGSRGAPATAGRAIAGRIPRSVCVAVAEAGPPHAAVAFPVASPPAWWHATQVARAAAADHGCVVVSRPPVTGLRALRSGYARAVADAGLAVQVSGDGGVLVTADDLVIPRMLSLLDAADQRALLRPIAPILALSPALCAAYLHTLDALRRCSTQATAAAELHLHVNTLRYRLARIEEMTGLQLAVPAHRLALDLAVLLVHLRGVPRATGGHEIEQARMDGTDPSLWTGGAAHGWDPDGPFQYAA